MAYQCPLCHSPMTRQARAYVCENRHQFDIAKEGYVNLMPVQHKRSKDPGDNKAMIQARRRFLNGGHYDAMRDRVTALCAELLTNHAPQLLDLGCGEGYYTTHIANVLLEQHSDTKVYGLDISKVAVRFAAKRYPECHFSVASSQRLPFADNSLDAIVRIYAPSSAQEMLRCIRPGGFLLTVTPAARHLFEYKARIYDSVRLHEESPETLDGFTLEHSEKVNYTMTLPGDDAFDLLQMTPFYWHASDEFRHSLTQASVFPCEADFMLHLYRKK